MLRDTAYTTVHASKGDKAVASMQVMQQPEAMLFSAPVSDADAPGYCSIVSHPMDLGSIKSRLQRKHYQHPADVYADIRQVVPSPHA